MKVRFLSPLKVLYEGDAKAVGSKNNKGPFSILPGHAQFITLLKSQPVKIIEKDGKEIIFTGENTFVLYTFNNEVTIFSDNSDLKMTSS